MASRPPSMATNPPSSRLAANTRGVVSVTNRILVSPPKVVAANTLVGTTEQSVSDSWITTKVKSTLLYSSNVVGTDIAVTTKQGVVTLDGRVGSGAERALAIDLTKNVKGVKAVDSKALTF